MRSSRPTKGLEAVEGEEQAEEQAEEDVVEEGRLVVVGWSEDAPGPAVVDPQLRPREERGPAPGAGLEAVVLVGAEAAAEEGRVVVELKGGRGRDLQ